MTPDDQVHIIDRRYCFSWCKQRGIDMGDGTLQLSGEKEVRLLLPELPSVTNWAALLLTMFDSQYPLFNLGQEILFWLAITGSDVNITGYRILKKILCQGTFEAGCGVIARGAENRELFVDLLTISASFGLESYLAFESGNEMIYQDHDGPLFIYLKDETNLALYKKRLEYWQPI